MALEIELTPIAFNTFSVTLDDENYVFQTIWSGRGDFGGTWRLSILNGQEEPIVQGLALYPARVLNGEYLYNRSPKGFLVITNDSPDRPDFDSLGSTLRLFYITEEELHGGFV